MSGGIDASAALTAARFVACMTVEHAEELRDRDGEANHDVGGREVSTEQVVSVGEPSLED